MKAIFRAVDFIQLSVAKVRPNGVNGKCFRIGMLLAVMAFCAGCSGIHASKSVSPLDFILPGLIKNDAPVPTPAAPCAPAELLAQVN